MIILDGHYQLKNVAITLFNFVIKRGKNVVLIGEQHPDMTFGWDYFDHIGINAKGTNWSSQSIHIMGPSSPFSERVSVNSRMIKFENDCGEFNWEDKSISHKRFPK